MADIAELKRERDSAERGTFLSVLLIALASITWALGVDWTILFAVAGIVSFFAYLRKEQAATVRLYDAIRSERSNPRYK